MPELVWKFSTFKLRWFPLFAVFTPLNVWTDEGQPCDSSASCSILPAFRMCTRHYTTCVGIPIFRHQSYPDKGRLIQKSPVCWDYVPEMGFARGKRWAWLYPSAAGSSRQLLECPALRDEFRESWGEDMARDLEWFRVDTNWHTTSNTSFHNEKQRDYDLDYHWQQHFWNIWKIAYIPIIFQALCGPWILDRSTALRDNDFPNFGWGSVFQEKPGSTFPVPERCWGPRCRWQVLPTPTCILWLWNLVIGNPAFTVDFPIETLGFHGQATLLEDVHVRSWIIDDHNMT